jgi:ATP-dependent Lon protease
VKREAMKTPTESDVQEKFEASGAVAEQHPGSELMPPASVLPPMLYLLPLSERPYFPAQTLPLIMNETPWLPTVKKVGETQSRMVGLVLVRPEQPDQAQRKDFYSIGTAVRMHNPLRAENKMQFIAEGVARFRIVDWVSDKPPYLAQVEYPADGRNESSDELKAYALAIINSIRELMPLNPLYNEELKFFLARFSPNEPSALTDFAATLTTASKDQLQQVLESFNLRRRMEKVLVLIKKELDLATLQSHIRSQVESKIETQQREFFLREQLKAIQKELGIAKDDRTADLERFQERVAKLALPPAAKKCIDDELQKLSVLESASSEYAVTRNYLDWLTQLPWGKYSKDKLDLTRARRILDRDHYGLDDVKERIIEFLAVGKLKGGISGSILLLVGPPGVGKTSVGRSIAEALGREFYRFSLGGMRDEAEIKGHRRTYIGAMPGKFIQAMKEVGIGNPVIMLDEVDKVGTSFHGDPASALLEVLDPEQNTDFLDHYLDVRFDLSKALFICTANQVDTIPGPLLDRMELLRLAGYITAEKVKIAKHYLWPKQLAKTGIPQERLVITEPALRHVAEGYAREAGVRSLEKQLGRVVRKAAVRIVGGHDGIIRVGVKEVESYLGKPVFTMEKPIGGVGVVTGLAWTAMGGSIMSIEATRVHTKNRGFKLTGQLGNVMKESADIAYSYVSSHLEEFRGDPAFFDGAFVHLHVPEGATRKDGPSAGITIATALLSLARNEKTAGPVALTGELTLTGQVLPVGGIREKVIAARRNRIMDLVLPEANRRDYEKLPVYVKAGFRVRFVKHYREVLQQVFPGKSK